jgi:hypothetical protein
MPISRNTREQERNNTNNVKKSRLVIKSYPPLRVIQLLALTVHLATKKMKKRIGTGET